MEKYDTDVEEKTHQLEVLKASKASDLAKLQDLTKKVMPLESVLTSAVFPWNYSSAVTRKVTVTGFGVVLPGAPTWTHILPQLHSVLQQCGHGSFTAQSGSVLTGLFSNHVKLPWLLRLKSFATSLGLLVLHHHSGLHCEIILRLAIMSDTHLKVNINSLF